MSPVISGFVKSVDYALPFNPC